MASVLVCYHLYNQRKCVNYKIAVLQHSHMSHAIVVQFASAAAAGRLKEDDENVMGREKGGRERGPSCALLIMQPDQN